MKNKRLFTTVMALALTFGGVEAHAQEVELDISDGDIVITNTGYSQGGVLRHPVAEITP